MSTENSTREARHARRSSYGSDLDAPVIAHQPSRQRAHSNDNLLRGEHSAIKHDECSKMFPWRNDVLPDRSSPSPPSPNNAERTLEQLIDKSHQKRPTSQIGFERIIETHDKQPTSDREHRQSVYTGEDDRQKYISQGETLSYGNGTSPMINMCVVSPPKHIDSHIAHVEIPEPVLITAEKSPSPLSSTTTSPKQPSNDISGNRWIATFDTTLLTLDRCISLFIDNFSRLTLNDKHNNHVNAIERQHSNDVSTKTMPLTNPLVTKTSAHTVAYETNHFSVISTGNESTHDIHRSRDSSPSTTTSNHRTSSATSGYASSNVPSEEVTRRSVSPPSAYVPQHDYLNVGRLDSIIERISRCIRFDTFRFGHHHHNNAFSIGSHRRLDQWIVFHRH
jgi:hypothetical protein